MKAALRAAILFGAAAAAVAGDGRWIFAGPPGRVSAIAVDVEGRVFAVTAQGMWRSADGGASWQLADTRLGSGAVRAIAGDPLRPGTVMAVGCGGYETVDGGDHWYPVPGLSPSDCSFETLQADPTQVEGFFASGSAGLFRTRFGSGGIEWGAIGQDRFTGTTYATANDTFPRRIYAAPASGGLFVSRDGGVTWSLGADPPARIRQIQGTSGAIATTDGGLFWTLDGLTWQDASGALAGESIASVFFPRDRAPADPNRVSYAATASGIFRAPTAWENFSEGFPAGGARTVVADRTGRMVYALPTGGDGILVYRYPLPALSVLDPPISIPSTRSTRLRVFIDPPQPFQFFLELTSSDDSVISFPSYASNQIAAAPLGTETLVFLSPRRAEVSPVTVTLRAPPELGGASVLLPVQVLNPRPVIGGISPRSVTAGAAAFELFISDYFPQRTFGSGIEAYWNGSPRPSRLVFPAVCPLQCPPPVLVVSIRPEDVASPGSATVTVVNPPPGGGAADPFQITIAPVPPREPIRPDAPKVPREPRPLPPRLER